MESSAVRSVMEQEPSAWMCRTLLSVFDRLVENGATVIVIEHDLDLIRNADYIIDMGPGGGEDGGFIVAAGTPDEVALNPESVTGKYLMK